MSRQLGRASMTLSLAGIAVTLLTVAIIVANGGFYVHPRNGTATGNNTVDDYVRSAYIRLPEDIIIIIIVIVIICIFAYDDDGRQTPTDASEQKKSGPLGGPVIIIAIK